MARKKKNEDELTPMGCAFSFILIGAILVFSGAKIWGLLVIVVGGFLAWLFYKSEKTSIQEMENRNRNQLSVSVEMSEDDYEYSIKGINYCNIDDSMLGDFIGTARALKSNPHDPYAVGVYRGSKRVGFLPKGNQELHERIMAVGGSVDADGYIAKANEDGRTFYYGKVNLLGI